MQVFYQIPLDRGADKFGMFLFGALHVAFANMSEVPIAVVNKYTCYKHVSSGMYPSLAYVLAVSLLHIPIAFAESLVFSVILYFMCGLVAEVSRFFFFVFTLFLVDVAMAGFLRIFAYALPDMETAQVAPGPIISIQMLFAGFLITRQKMSWLLFMHYVSLFGYALRSLAQNEFLSEPYSSRPVADGPTLGEIFLQYFDFQLEPEWKWGGLGFIGFFIIVVNILSGLSMGYVRIERNIGSSRQKEALLDTTERPAQAESSEEAENLAATPRDIETGTASGVPSAMVMSPMSPNPNVLSPAPRSFADEASPRVAPAPHVTPLASAASVLPFTEMTVVFIDIRYTVKIPAKKEGSIFSGNVKHIPAYDKVLLQGVSGYALPGTLTALMGASGAGKTTLLDVIAGRKNSGKMEGQIFLNGFPKEQKSFARLTAYVEQMDIHSPLATVREALEFSAALRLPADVSPEKRAAFVTEILTMLELDDISDRKIGEVGAADGLSPGQRKRLTIGVELASNAPIIFLDEPTTGLDSRAAAVVVRVVKKIASSGRTVITTIHQPSADLFFMMDNLLLLQRGGHQVYLGPVGNRGREVVRYMESIPDTPRCPKKMNPASWMLDVLAGTDSSGGAHVRQGAERQTSAIKSQSSFALKIADVGHVEGGELAASLHIHAPPPEDMIRSTSSAVVRQTSRGNPSDPMDVPPGSIDASRPPPSADSVGPVDYQAILLHSALWKESQSIFDAHGKPKLNSKPVTFDSVYARGFWFQVGVILGRNHRSYMRNVDYNFVRIMTLFGLHVLFGTIYYHISADDLGGVQSLVSVMFMTTAFM
jgi:ABC-type multidrug transport system ATPase subunit/ABC-type multidrug transport system permease subunit